MTDSPNNTFTNSSAPLAISDNALEPYHQLLLIEPEHPHKSFKYQYITCPSN